MKISHTLVCFIFLTMHDGDIGQVQAGVYEHRGVKGGNIEVGCEFPHSGTKKLFCQRNCKKDNILIATTKDTDKKGRYSIKYVRNNFLYVSITQLKRSDTGWYRCHLSGKWGELHQEFYIHVTEATTTKTTTTTTKGTTKTTTTTTKATTKSLSFSSETSKQPDVSPGAAAAGLLPSVCLILAIVIAALSAALLIFCKRRRATKPEGAPLEVEHADITQTSHLYEEIRDRSSPMEVSSAHPEYSQPEGDENMDFYSLATAPQNTAEGDLNNLDYTEVDFPHVHDTNSAPCGTAADVVHDRPQEHARLSNHDTSPPLYSTVGEH